MQFVHSQKEATAALLLFLTKSDPEECHSIVVVVIVDIVIIIIIGWFDMPPNFFTFHLGLLPFVFPPLKSAFCCTD
jgi:hypothetical protein